MECHNLVVICQKTLFQNYKKVIKVYNNNKIKLIYRKTNNKIKCYPLNKHNNMEFYKQKASIFNYSKKVKYKGIQNKKNQQKQELK